VGQQESSALAALPESVFAAIAADASIAALQDEGEAGRGTVSRVVTGYVRRHSGLGYERLAEEAAGGDGGQSGGGAVLDELYGRVQQVRLYSPSGGFIFIPPCTLNFKQTKA
jgi:hypothetical protein